MARKLFNKSPRRWLKRNIVTPKLIKTYLRQHKIAKLHVGSGRNFLEGWLNTDIHYEDKRVAYLNTAKPFPLQDNSIDYIFSEHHIEHLTYEQGQFMLKEFFRVLKPGGKVRIATPDMENILSLYNPELSETQTAYIHWVTDKFLPDVAQKDLYRGAYVINGAFHNWQHRFLFDRLTLSDSLTGAGFSEVTSCDFGESTDEVLAEIESHDKAAGDLEMVIFETFILEAKKI